jgi:hypothetical protein
VPTDGVELVDIQVGDLAPDEAEYAYGDCGQDTGQEITGYFQHEHRSGSRFSGGRTAKLRGSDAELVRLGTAQVDAIIDWSDSGSVDLNDLWVSSRTNGGSGGHVSWSATDRSGEVDIAEGWIRVGEQWNADVRNWDIHTTLEPGHEECLNLDSCGPYMIIVWGTTEMPQEPVAIETDNQPVVVMLSAWAEQATFAYDITTDASSVLVRQRVSDSTGPISVDFDVEVGGMFEEPAWSSSSSGRRITVRSSTGSVYTEIETIE